MPKTWFIAGAAEASFRSRRSGGRRAQPGLGAYQTTAWAVRGLFEILARELAPVGVLATEPSPPVRLLLGSDAAWLAPQIAAARTAEDAAWHELTMSTDRDGLADFAGTEVAQMIKPSRPRWLAACDGTPGLIQPQSRTTRFVPRRRKKTP